MADIEELKRLARKAWPKATEHWEPKIDDGAPSWVYVKTDDELLMSVYEHKDALRGVEAALRMLAGEPSADYERGYAKAIADVVAYLEGLEINTSAELAAERRVLGQLSDFIRCGDARGASDE